MFREKAAAGIVLLDSELPKIKKQLDENAQRMLSFSNPLALSSGPSAKDIALADFSAKYAANKACADGTSQLAEEHIGRMFDALDKDHNGKVRSPLNNRPQYLLPTQNDGLGVTSKYHR
jgi:hypothetical protein